jgi:hypothetical protein
MRINEWPVLVFLNILFTFLHFAIIGFNLAGWIWPKTRKAHLIVLAGTAASWFLLGIWYGWGYCFLTDWHWDVKEKLGETNLPNSFVKYFADKVTGRDFPPSLVDTATLSAFLAAIALGIYFSFFKKTKSTG